MSVNGSLGARGQMLAYDENNTCCYSNTQQHGRISKSCLHEKLDPSEYTLRDSIYSVKEAGKPQLMRSDAPTGARAAEERDGWVPPSGVVGSLGGMRRVGGCQRSGSHLGSGDARLHSENTDDP